jgi:vitamin K-dependent gamma-carboxylase
MTETETTARHASSPSVGLGDRLAAFARGLGAPTDPAGLAFFRFAIGVIVAVSAIRFIAFGWVEELFVAPRFHFKYLGFHWVPAMPAELARPVFVAIAILGVAVAVGFLYRASVLALFVLFAWIQLIDATNYLNHYVLVALLLALLACFPLGRTWAIDAWLRPATRLATLPAWMTWLVRFQVACVYVFAGKAKLGTDWLLHAQPLSIWLGSRTDVPLVGRLFHEPWVAYAFSWAGFVFDSTIVAFLIARRTRAVAYLVVIGFHAMTMALFPIGMFPVIMVVAATIFFDHDWPCALHARLRGRPPVEAPSGVPAPPSRAAIAAGVVFCAANLLVPLRMHLYRGDVLWHEQGMRLAWKVMVREKNASVTYHLEDRATGRTWFRKPRELLDARQEREFGTQPDLVLQLAHAFAADERARGRDVAVRAEALVSLNGRAAKLLVDPTIDLTQVHDGLARAAWVTDAPGGPPLHRRRSRSE